MAYRWKPSKSARRDFAENMKNSDFSNDYYARKEAKADKRRSGSQFEYQTAGGSYVPTQAQYNAAVEAERLCANQGNQRCQGQLRTG